IIPAAGSGTRMGGTRMGADTGKLFLEISSGISILEATLRQVLESGVCSGIAVAARESDLEYCREIAERVSRPGFTQVVPGGASRQESVTRCLELVPQSAELIAIHDGARPLCPPKLIREAVEAAAETGAAILAAPCTSTLKRAPERIVEETISREGIWLAQ